MSIWDVIIEENFVKTTDVSEIQTNGGTSLFYKKHGLRYEVPNVFQGESHYIQSVLELIEKTTGISYDRLPEFLEEGRLTFPGGQARCHIVLPPACDYPQITIARKTVDLTTMDDIRYSGSLTSNMQNFITAATLSGCTMLISGGTGSGKALMEDTPVLTSRGMKPIQSVRAGDLVFDRDSNPVKVKNKFNPVIEKAYQITFSNGETIVACEDHLWLCSILDEKPSIPREKTILDVNLKDLSDLENQDGYVLMSDIIKRLPNLSKNMVYRILKDVPRSNKSKRLYKKSEVYLAIKQEHLQRQEIYNTIQDLKEQPSFVRQEKVLSTRELVEGGLVSPDGRKKYAVESIYKPVEFKEKHPPLESYLMGLWFSSGVFGKGYIPIKYASILEHIPERYKKKNIIGQIGDDLYILYSKGLKCTLKCIGAFRETDLLSIANHYKYTSSQSRIEFLRGVSDGAGFVSSSGVVSYKIKEGTIKDELVYIIASLGWGPDILEDGIRFYPTVQLFSDAERKGLLEKRLEQGEWSIQQTRIYIENIVEFESDGRHFYCLEVDSPTKTFLCGNSLIPTHNTTFMEALTKTWPEGVRVGVVEDAQELILIQPNVTYLHSSVWKPGMDSNNVATLDWCVQQMQRMRVDRLIIGEVRGREALGFLIAANSGAEGSICTVHANNPRMALQKFAQFVIMAMPQDQRVANRNISSTVDIVIQLERKIDGRYRTTGIEEVTRALANDSSATIITTPLFSYIEETDTWDDSCLMSESLRERLYLHGFDLRTFLPSNKAGLYGQDIY